jgi:hypothetical protein
VSLTTVDVGDYQPVWRIRQSGNELRFEVSPDGAAWTGVSTPLEIDVSLGDLGVRIGGDQPGGRALFDDLNPPP